MLLLGGPFFEDIWYAAGGHFPEGATVIQIEESPERLAFNHRLDAGLVGDLAASLAALTEAVRAGGTAEFKPPRNAATHALAELRAREKEALQGAAGEGLEPRADLDAARHGGTAARPARQCRHRRREHHGEPRPARAFDYRGFGDYFGGRGGGIGQGLAGAIGVKVAMPDRPVVAVSGDGSAMYSIQALWTAAHHKLAIVFVVLANREYRILKHNVDVWRQNFRSRARSIPISTWT